MKPECEITMDLIPLCVEGIGSPSSAEYVRKHTAGCKACNEYYESLRGHSQLLPAEEIAPLKQLRRGMKVRMGLAALVALLLTLTVCAGVLVCAIVPVWLTAEEAVMDVTLTQDGQVQLLISENASESVRGMNTVYYSGFRLNFLRSIEQREPSYETHSVGEDGTFWYLGSFADEADTCLWGTGGQLVSTVTENWVDRTVQYLFWISLILGAAIFFCGLLLRKKRGGGILCGIGTLLACCAAACLFVTDGHLLLENLDYLMGIWPMTLRRAIVYVSIGVMTLLSWGTIISTALLVKTQVRN